MKYLFGLIFILTSCQLFSQNIDSMLFLKINNYRVTNGLIKLTLDEKAYSLTNSHSIYLIKIDSLTHNENINGKEIKIDSRIGKEYAIENIVGGYFIPGMNSVELVDMLFNEWIESPGHKKNILDIKIKKGAISIKIDFDKETVVADFIAF